MPNLPAWLGSASSVAGRLNSLMVFILLVAIFFSLLIGILTVYFGIKYHHRSDADRSQPPSSNVAIEIVWTAIPLVLMLVMFVWGAWLFIRMHQAPPGAAEIYVVGKQWMWKVQQADGRREINEIHVPVGRPMKLIMTSEDVIHSLFIPAFRVKQDLLPGRYTSEWFTATQPGKYRFFCAQYCGTSHASMVGWVYAMAPADYAAWLAGHEAGVPMAVQGEALFTRMACATCHLASNSGRGPSLQGLLGTRVALQDGSTVKADDSYIRESILQPQAKIVKGYPAFMPSYQGQLTEEELADLVRYVEALK